MKINCDKCGKAILDSPGGNYITGCEHYPLSYPLQPSKEECKCDDVYIDCFNVVRCKKCENVANMPSKEEPESKREVLDEVAPPLNDKQWDLLMKEVLNKPESKELEDKIYNSLLVKASDAHAFVLATKGQIEKIANLIRSEKKKSFLEGIGEEKDIDIPMGVSQWRNHGKDYGYWEFFEKESLDKRNKEIILWAENYPDADIKLGETGVIRNKIEIEDLIIYLNEKR